MTDDTRNRILKGIEYFRDIKPSEWTPATTLHAKVLFGLMEKYMSGQSNVVVVEVKEEPKGFEAAKQVFSNELEGVDVY